MKERMVKEMARSEESKKKQREYDKEYKKRAYKNLTFRVSVEHDTDVLERINSVPNMRQYILNLIREDIARSKQ